MEKIIYIKEAKAKGYLIIGVLCEGEKKAYAVLAAEYSACGSPIRGDILDFDTIARFSASNESYKAMKKALSLLSYTDNSEKNLRLKLMRAGFSRDVAEEATMEAVRLGYINEDAQLERIILHEVNMKLTGPMKLIPKLAAKGYSVSDIKRVVSRLSDMGEIDFAANRERLINEKLPDDFESDEKYKLLRKYGYKTFE